MPIVIDPNKQVTDPTLLSALAKQGIDYRYVELYQDYALSQGVKGKSPYAKFYRHTENNKRWMVVSQLPMVNADGVKVEVGWDKVGAKFVSKVNQFQAQVSGKTTTITCINDQPTGQRQGNSLTYTPHLYLDGVEVSCGKETLLAVDPINASYQNNVLEWDYGICKRRLRLIEGKLLGTWIFASNPNGEVRIQYNQAGDFKLHLGQYAINDNEELIPADAFANPAFGYPFIVSDSLTFYPDAHTETVSVDGRTYYGVVGQSWATARAAASGVNATSADTTTVVVQSERDETAGNISRCPFLFDTSTLPDNAIITAAIFSLYSTAVKDTSETTYPANLSLVSCNPATNTDLVVDDYNIALWGSTKFATDILLTIFGATAQYYDFAMNSSGIAAISLTGITKLGIRGSNDIANTAPTLRSYGFGYYSEQGTGYKPKLVVTYTSGTFQLSITDGFKGGDTLSQLMTVNLSVTEGLKGGDALGQSSLMSLLETEGIKLGDSGLATLTALLGVAEGFKAGDSPGVLANMYPSLSEGIKIGDFALLSMLANIQLTDGTKLGDSVLRTILANLQIVEGMKLGDALNLTLSEGIYQLTLNEGIKFGDTEALTALMSLTLADGTRLGDTLLASLPSEVMLALILKLYNRALALKLNERDFNIRLR